MRRLRSKANLFAALLLALAPACVARAQATSFPDKPSLAMGAAWYPEHWPESRWEADLALMQAAHVNVVRIAEFAWSTMEPAEGQYDFAWLDRAIAAAGRHHIMVVLGTPTAAPPAWLTSRYPDVLRVDENDRPDEHGNRKQFSLTSPRYREFARKIAGQMALRYGHNPNVVGWQIDNEIGAPSFDPATRAAWHTWLKAKYGTVASLNEHWTTSYWSQTYDSFDQVPMHSKGENPGLLLDYRRFGTDMWKSYVDDQAQAIRAHADKRQFVTTNSMHWNAGFDHYKLHETLDLAAWDDYVTDGKYDWLDNASLHDLVRGYKRRNFWVMETQPVFVNWVDYNGPLAPGQMREKAWQAVGHGADAVLYWQWRSALNGQEQYFGDIVGPDGKPVPGYDEISRIGAEFAKAGAAVSGTSPHSDVALLHDYDSRWAIDFQRHNRDFDPIKEFEAFYQPLARQAQSVDVISADADLAGYKLVVAPALNVMTPAQAASLTAYVKAGGNLVLGPRTGMKDPWNALYTTRQPGPLAGLLGGQVEQFYALIDPAPISGDLGQGTAGIWAEALSAKAPDAKVVMRYGKSNGWLDDQPAVITRKVGKGSITYVGAWMDPALMGSLARHALAEAGVKPLLAAAPADIEVMRRTGGGRELLILINHASAAQAVTLPAPMRELLADAPAAAVANLPAHGVGVYEAAGR